MSSTAVPPVLGTVASGVSRTFGAHPFHTDGDLLALAFTDAGALWSIEEPGVLRHWNVDGKQQTKFQALDEPSTLWAIGPAAGLVAAASDELQVWNAETGALVAGWPEASWIGAVAFSPAGDVLATGHDDGKVRLWDPKKQKLIGEFRAHGRPISTLAFNGDGKKLATAGEDKAIHLWDVATQKPLGSLLGHTDRIPALAWHPDGKRFLSAGWDTTARVWDLDTCEPIILLNAHSGQVLTFALSADGAMLGCADSANSVHVWDLAKYRILHVLKGQGEVRAMAWAPNGKLLAAGGTDRVVHLWDAERGASAEPAVDPQASRTSLAVRGAGKRIYSLGAGTSLRAWDAKSGETVLDLENGGPLRAAAVSPDGKLAAGALALPGEPEVWHGSRNRRSSSPENMLAIWNAETGKLIRFLAGPKPPVTALAFSPDAVQLATGGFLSDDVWLWNAANGEPSLLIPEAAGGCAIEAIAWHPTGKLLAVSGIDYMATGGTDGKTGIWSVTGKHPVAWIAGGGTALAYRPNGQHLAIASLVQTVRVWDVSEKNEIPTHALELVGHLDAVTCLAYSPDGSLLATGSDDRSVRLWNADTGLQQGQVDLDTQVEALAFAPDGQMLYTGNGNTSCYQLDLRQVLADGA